MSWSRHRLYLPAAAARAVQRSARELHPSGTGAAAIPLSSPQRPSAARAAPRSRSLSPPSGRTSTLSSATAGRPARSQARAISSPRAGPSASRPSAGTPSWGQIATGAPGSHHKPQVAPSGTAARAGIALRQALEDAAARTLGEGTERIALVDDWLVGEDGRNRVSLGEAAASLVGEAGAIEVDGRFEAGAHGHDEPGDYDYGAYAVEVEVDPETGTVTVVDAVLVADVGTVVNPVAHQGQLVGGFAFGFGGAVLEKLGTDESGRVTTLNLGDYKLPTALDLPLIETVIVEVPYPKHPYGARGVGENPIVPPVAAIANAIYRATGQRMTELPMTPARVLEKIGVI